MVDYPFKPLEQQNPEPPIISANMDDSEDESVNYDFRRFETSCDDANEEFSVEVTPEDAGTSDSNTVGCQCISNSVNESYHKSKIFKKKMDESVNVIRYKARLVHG